MSQKKMCVAVPKKEGERIRIELKQHNLLDERYKIMERNGLLYLPLKVGALTHSYPVVECSMEHRAPAFVTKFRIGYDTIGDIAIIGWSDNAQKVAFELLETRKNIKVVLAAISGVQGEYRLKDFVFVAGERRTETEHKENGSRLLVDVSKVYFSPRLATERHRLSELVQPNETIADMFAGVGPFTVLLARKTKKAIAFELNPTAFDYLRKNLERNKLHNVEACLGNVKSLAPKFAGAADRVIMNLPHNAFNFLGEALTLLSSNGGFIHYYDIKPEEEFLGTVEKVEEFILSLNRSIKAIHLKKVRSYAPHRYHIALDVTIGPY